MTDSRVKIFTIAHVPQERAHAWLQHLRDFDTAHPDCHFEVIADAPRARMRDVMEMMRLDPELTITDIIERK